MFLSRSMLFLSLFVAAVMLAAFFNVPRKVKILALNMIYGDEMREIKGFRVAVESTNPQLENRGLPRETVRQMLIAQLKKAGIKVFTEAEWREAEGKPVLNIVINATETDNDLFQYAVLIEVEKTESRGPGTLAEKAKTLWASTGMGEGKVADIKVKLEEALGLFIQAYAGL